MDQELRNNRKVKKGTVISDKMQKTVVVSVEERMRHPQYGKVVSRKKKYYAHNESAALKVGDVVQIIETRPLSKTKCWRVVAS